MKNTCCVLLIAVAIAVTGCTSTKCRPILFPYVEYNYQAAPQELSGLSNIDKENEIIEFHKLNIVKPIQWMHEFPFGNTLHLFTEGKKRSIILSYNESRSFDMNDYKDIEFIGCDNFEATNNDEIKTSKNFISDLFMFTADQYNDMKKDATFWHYFILWSKSTALHGMEKLIHYQGKNVEAFRIDSAETDGTISTSVDLFHKKIEPNFFTISTSFDDDAFLYRFVDMIDISN